MKKIFFILIFSFLLNFIWEISQAFLYAPHYSGITGLLIVHLWASLGDILMVFIILALNALIFAHDYAKRIEFKSLMPTIFIGFVLATLVEKYALATGRWAYDALMPIIPWLSVGLTPILQMMIIPSVVTIFWSRINKSKIVPS